MSIHSMFPQPPVLCWVTNRHRTNGRKLVDIAHDVVNGGFNMIRVREPDLGEDAFNDLINQLSDITRGKAILMSNFRSSDNSPMRSKVGLHFPEGLSPENIVFHSDRSTRIVGRSVHSVEVVWAANNQDVDYLTYGTVFPSKSHPGGRAQGLKNLSSTVLASSHPILAIGGIKPGNLSDVMSTGVYGISVIGAISEATNPLEAAKKMTDIAMKNSLSGEQWR